MTQKMNENPGVIETVIDMLKHINVDSETMQHIIEQVGMNDQVLRQLIMNNPESDIKDLLNEKIEINNSRMKTFQIKKIGQATTTHIFEVEAKTEEEALHKVLNAEVLPIDMEIDEYDIFPEYDVEEI